MELTSRQRILAFALTVLALTALGIFLVVSGTSKHPSASSPPTSPPATTAQPPVSAPPASSAPVQPTGQTTVSSNVNIYKWLPFSQQGLARAATVATEFSAYYGTYSYSENGASYTSRMQGLANSQLVQVISADYSAPGLASLRDQQKQVAAGSAVIDSLRTFGSSSLTFVITINQKITEAHSQTSQQSHQYAVTVANTGGGWQVNNIELASTGNQ
jgi:hypothetical protein